jgi:hypothetical protein
MNPEKSALTFMIFDFIKKPVNIFIFIFVTLFAFTTINYINDDKLFTGNDGQSLRAIRFYRFVTTGQEQYKNAFEDSYPPLMPIISLPFLALSGNPDIKTYNRQNQSCNSFKNEINSFEAADKALRYSLIPFGVIFLLSVYGIGRHLGDEYSGIAAMCLAAASPHVLNLSRHYYLDFPQTAVSALALYMLYKSNGFSDRTKSLLFGIFFSIACWIKWSAIFFLAAPFIIASIPVLLRIRKVCPACLTVLTTFALQIGGFIIFFVKLPICVNIETNLPGWFLYYLIIIILPAAAGMLLIKYFDKKIDSNQLTDTCKNTVDSFKNIYYSAIVFIISVTPFYFAKSGAVKSRFVMEIIADSWKRNPLENLYAGFYSIGTTFSFSYLLLAIGIIFILIFRKDKFYDRLLLVLSVASSLLIMMKVGHSELRYYVTLVIFAAPLAGFWVCYLKKFRLAAICLLAILSILTFTWFSFTPVSECSYYTTINTESHPDFTHPAPVKILKPVAPDSQKFNFGTVLTKSAEIFTNNSPGATGKETGSIVILAQPSDHIPFINDRFDDRLRLNNLTLNYLIMTDPVNELKRFVSDHNESKTFIVVIVFKNKEYNEAIMKDLQTSYKKIKPAGEILDFGSGYSAQIVEITKDNNDNH